MEDNNKRRLDYNADFQYEEDYFSDYTHINISQDSNNNELEYDDDFMQGIQDTIDDLVVLIPGLPLQLQTAINQVFKPILLDWRENFKDKKYPSRIPDPDKGVIKPIEPEPEPGPVPPSPRPNPNPDPDPNPNPNPDPDPNPNPSPDPNPDPEPGPIPPSPNPDPDPDPNPNPDPDPNPNPSPNPDPNPNPSPGPGDKDPESDPNDPDDPNKVPKDPWYPGILPPGPLPPIKNDGSGDGSGGNNDGGGGGGDNGYRPPGDTIYPGIIPLVPDMNPDDYPVTNNPEIDNEDDLFTPATSKKYVYEDIDPIEIVKLEFDKNVLDLYEYYTNRLKKVLGDYYTQILELAGTQLSSNAMDFMLNPITFEQANVIETLRHVMDSALRGEVMGDLKIEFSLSMFSLESSLYHMKNMKVVFELRLRYAEAKKAKNENKTDSLMNRILDALRTTYDAKYDNAYINWYKYLNSSLEVLADIMRTVLTCLRSKATIIKKGGIKEE